MMSGFFHTGCLGVPPAVGAGTSYDKIIPAALWHHAGQISPPDPDRQPEILKKPVPATYS